MSESKACVKCGEVKSIGDFYTRTNGGRWGTCMSCVREESRVKTAARKASQEAERGQPAPLPGTPVARLVQLEDRVNWNPQPLRKVKIGIGSTLGSGYV